MGGTAWGPLAAYAVAAGGAAYQNYREHKNHSNVTDPFFPHMPRRMPRPGVKAIGTTVRYARCDYTTKRRYKYTAKKLLERGYHYYLGRWQTIRGGGIMNPYLQLTTPTDFSLNLTTNYFGGTAQQLPVYLFNLTDPTVAYLQASPETGTANCCWNVPVFRMTVDNATLANNRHYSWTPQTTITGDPSETDSFATTYTGILEEANQGTQGIMTGSPGYPPVTDQVRHDWSSLSFAIRGAAKYPTKFHFYHVSFDEHATPIRQYTQSAPQTNNQTLISYPDANPSSDQHNVEITAAWDHFLCPKLISPLHKYRKPKNFEKSIRFHSHHCVTVEPNLTTEQAGVNDASSGRVLFHNEFYKSGQWLNCRTSGPPVTYTMPAAAPVPMVGTLGTGFNSNLVGFLPGATNPASVRYLMVLAESYAVVDTNSPAAGACPTMDVVFRKKHSYGPRGG